jgi:hypothetical protein
VSTETVELAEPEWMNVDQMLAHYGIKKRRWLTDRLSKKHPDHIQHHRFLEPMFNRADRALFEDTHLRSTRQQTAPAMPDRPEFDPALVAKGRRVLDRAS